LRIGKSGMSQKPRIFEKGSDRYQPDDQVIEQYSNYKLNQNFLARCVGIVAIGLPLLMLTSIFVEGACMRASVSHFYYEVFYGDLFVGAMFFIGTFLLAYRGETRAENALATAAGFGAFGTALFPARGDGCSSETFSTRLFAYVSEDNEKLSMEPLVGTNTEGYFRMIELSHILHSVFAILLSGFLAYYALAVFTRVIPAQRNADGTLKRAKRLRNWIYRFTGFAIVFAILSMTVQMTLKLAFHYDVPYWEAYSGSFIAEMIAMSAFGLGWIVKGRALGQITKDAGE
jgi:hypothetical protein